MFLSCVHTFVFVSLWTFRRGKAGNEGGAFLSMSPFTFLYTISIFESQKTKICFVSASTTNTRLNVLSSFSFLSAYFLLPVNFYITRLFFSIFIHSNVLLGYNKFTFMPAHIFYVRMLCLTLPIRVIPHTHRPIYGDNDLCYTANTRHVRVHLEFTNMRTRARNM